MVVEWLELQTQELGFASVEAYVEQLLEKISVVMRGDSSARALDDEEFIAERLRALGYIE